MCFGRGKRVRRAAWARFFLLRSDSGCLSVCCCAGILISAPLRYFLFLFRSQRQSGDATFLAKRKWPKIGQRGFPFGNPFDGKGLCGPYPQSRQAAVTVVPTGHVPPANAAKQVGRKYGWRHLPLPSVGVPVGVTLQSFSTNRLAASPSG